MKMGREPDSSGWEQVTKEALGEGKRSNSYIRDENKKGG